jgi:hypothetical protein
MSRIGKAGFRALCRRFPMNSRQAALDHLNRLGRVRRRFDRTPTVILPLADGVMRAAEYRGDVRDAPVPELGGLDGRIAATIPLGK